MITTRACIGAFPYVILSMTLPAFRQGAVNPCSGSVHRVTPFSGYPMLSRLPHRLLTSVAAFRSDKRGQVAITFGLTLVPMITLLGAAVDYSNLRRSKTILQANVDAVVLGAQQQSITSNAALLTYAQRFVPATSAVYTSTDGSMCVTAQQAVSTNFLQVVRIASMSTTATACSLNQTQTTGTYEIALALDNTGSMAVADTTTAKTKMASEITAAKNFVTQMFAAIPAANMQISLVPFTTAVNVGTSNATASWMDTQGKSSIHWENFPKLGSAVSNYQSTAEATINSRFDLYSQINQSWAGCVEERPQPYTLTDTAASSGTPDTLYVPMFAPDESDTPNSSYRSYNSYLSDLGGTCVNGDAYDTVDAGTASGSITATYKDGTKFWGDNQQKFCKYLMKYAALNPPTLDVRSAIASWLTANGSPGNNNWTINGAAQGNYQVPATTIASLVTNYNNGGNKLYSVGSGSTSVSFCTNFNVGYSNQNGYYISSNSCSTQTGYYSAYAGWYYGYYTAQSTGLLTAAQANNPTGSSWTSTSNTITSTGWNASSGYTAWTGSGWGFGGSGWGSGTGWGWGSGLNSSTSNPGQTASGQASSQHIGSNQFNIGGGANSGCDATLQPVTTLSNNQTTLKANIDKMVANGATNLVSGLMWAWKTISPNGPFNTAAAPVKAYGTANNKKIIVFMTDGYNNWEPDDSQNGGVYSAFGYYKNNRVGALTVNGSLQTPTSSNNRSYLDAAFLQACTNAKNAGVEIYTVAFSIPNAPIDAQGQSTVQSCATDTAHYFKATNGTELSTFFQSIGQSVTQSYLRLKS